MESSSTAKVCAICGEPVVVEAGELAKGGFGNLWALANVVHDACNDKRKAREADVAAMKRCSERSSAWTRLCPKQFQNSDAWVVSVAGRRKLRQKPVVDSLNWTYGSKGLILFGAKSGTGKTTCAWVLCKREFDVGKVVVALTHSEIQTEAVRLARGDKESSWEKALKRCDLLLIDDLGKSRFRSVDGVGKCGEELLFSVVDARCNAQLPTIITSNSSGSEIQAAMSDERGEPFVRRLREYFVHVCFDPKETKE